MKRRNTVNIDENFSCKLPLYKLSSMNPAEVYDYQHYINRQYTIVNLYKPYTNKGHKQVVSHCLDRNEIVDTIQCMKIEKYNFDLC